MGDLTVGEEKGGCEDLGHFPVASAFFLKVVY